MLLVIDVGNTNIVLGIFKGKELMDHWRVSTNRSGRPMNTASSFATSFI